MGYSCKKSTVTREDLPPLPPGDQYAIFRKCRCGDSWCPSCGLRSVRRGLWRVREWAWDHVRTVVLTVDPKYFPAGPEASLRVLEDARSAFIRELNRRDAGVVDYQWFCEWHETGFPHYHVLLLMDKPGIAGQVGIERLRAAWKYGSYIHESWIKSARHWANWVGYAMKTGYMHKDASHQARLPAWAMRSTRRVRRTGGRSRQRDEREAVYQEQDLAEFIRSLGPREPDQVRDGARKLTNGEVIARCGHASYLLAIRGPKGEPADYGVARIPYADALRLPGIYVERLGWAVRMSAADFLQFYRDVSWEPHPALALPTTHSRSDAVAG